MVEVSKLTQHPKRPTRHPKKQIELLAKLISHQGWRASIVVSNRSGFITRGNGRYEAALFIGCAKVPVDFQEYASEKEELEDLVADNKIAELSELDEAQLAALLSDIKNVDPELFAMEFDELDKLLSEPEIRPVKYLGPPKMTWVLIGIPVVRFGEISAGIEEIAARADTIIDTTVNDDDQRNGQH